jgi:hypothetical protein
VLLRGVGVLHRDLLVAGRTSTASRSVDGRAPRDVTGGSTDRG